MLGDLMIKNNAIIKCYHYIQTFTYVYRSQ